MDDYYSTLGVPKTATQDEIKKAYKKLAFKFHPDVCKDFNAHEKFIKINEAYEFLSNPEKRAFYDNLRSSSNKSSKQNEQYQEWQEKARSTAKQNAQTEFSKYKQSVLDNLTQAYKTTKKGAEIGCGLYFGLTFLGSALFGIYKYIEYWVLVSQGARNFSVWTVLSILMILFFGLIGYLFIKSAIEE